MNRTDELVIKEAALFAYQTNRRKLVERLDLSDEAMQDVFNPLTVEMERPITPANGEPDPDIFPDEWFIEQARELHGCDGECEIDAGATVSRSSDGGAYVAAYWYRPK